MEKIENTTKSKIEEEQKGDQTEQASKQAIADIFKGVDEDMELDNEERQGLE